MSCVYSSGRSRGLFAEVEKLQDLISELSQGEVVGGGQGTVVNRQKPYRITMNIFGDLRPYRPCQNTIPKEKRTLSIRCPFKVNGSMAPASVSVRKD